jgi:hypothetical protein
MRCGDCKHFRRNTEAWEPSHAGKCESRKFEDISDIYVGREQYPEKDGVAYSDSEMYGAVLYVGEDFGCIHFEEQCDG